jgi:membrane-bound lytic murein transglycosylase D
MPDETRNYVPKLQAIKNIVADPERYAVLLPEVSNQPYFVSVKKTVNVDFTIAAELAEMPLEDFQALNPSLNQPLMSPQEDHVVILPRDKVDIFKANLAQYKGELSSWKMYDAKQGETFASIAAKFGIQESRLREANRIPTSVRSAGDQSLLIPTPAAQGLRITPQLAAAQAVRTHTVAKGESLATIARRYGTTVATLRALNNLKSDTVRIGMKLRIPGTGSRS